MAPEVFSHQQYSHKVDVFSFSVVVYELLSKKRAYHERLMSSVQIAWAVYKDAGVRPRLPEHWPPEVTRLLQSCWAQQPEERPEFRAIVAQLEGLVAQANRPESATGANELLAALSARRGKPASLLSRAIKASRDAFSARPPATFMSSLSPKEADKGTADKGAADTGAADKKEGGEPLEAIDERV